MKPKYVIMLDGINLFNGNSCEQHICTMFNDTLSFCDDLNYAVLYDEDKIADRIRYVRKSTYDTITGERIASDRIAAYKLTLEKAEIGTSPLTTEQTK